LMGFNGKIVDDSSGAQFYLAFFDALRVELFASSIGSLISPDNFKQALQPSLILNALEGRTKFNFLGTRTRKEVVATAIKKVRDDWRNKELAKFRAGRIAVEGEEPIIHSDRGTYIQLVELLKQPRGRNVLPPGIAESGPHRTDQAHLARNWRYKPMRF
ncbi:MAG: hypothetical protein ABL962_22330, partial [Fimbriimonadaceae bacterium]